LSKTLNVTRNLKQLVGNWQKEATKSRDDLKRLIQYNSADSTKTLSPENHHANLSANFLNVTKRRMEKLLVKSDLQKPSFITEGNRYFEHFYTSVSQLTGYYIF